MTSKNETSADFDAQCYKDCYREMARIRAFEQSAIKALDENLAFGAVHLSIGQEAVAVGVCRNLDRQDIILSTHRGHGHALAKGAAPVSMMRELFGREGGCCGGKGGSMHIADFDVGMLGANGVVAANINIAVGAAHGVKLQGQRRVVVCFFGDGAINRGPFLEGLNWAGVFGLPVVFVCEDNGFAATTRTSTMTAGAGPAARARALGLETVEIDGNDIVAVNTTAVELVQRAKDRVPQVLVAHTYRLTGHTALDAALYRPQDEVADKWSNDPITRCQALLEKNGITRDELMALTDTANNEMAAAYREAADSPWPGPRLAFADVQDIGNPGMEAF